jgi:hypothetical protein
METSESRGYSSIALLSGFRLGFTGIAEPLAPSAPFIGAGIEWAGLNVLAVLCRVAAMLVGRHWVTDLLSLAR